MKKLFIAVMVALMVATPAKAAEKKALIDIDPDEFTGDTQVMLKGAGDDHMALAWWIPNEFWGSAWARDPRINEADKQELLDVIAGTSILAVAQADISMFGAFRFYTQEEIEKNMVLRFTDADGRSHRLSPMGTIDPDLKNILGMLRPILVNAMGNLGSNMHFYILNDKTAFTSRLLDPYQEGKIHIQLTRKNEALIEATLDLPVNALFVPRKCPNGKPAHISWNYCPWSGEKLE